MHLEICNFFSFLPQHPAVTQQTPTEKSPLSPPAVHLSNLTAVIKACTLTYANHIEICIVLPSHHYISFAPSSSIPIEISIVVFCFRHCIPQLHNSYTQTTNRKRERERSHFAHFEFRSNTMDKAST
jgi:hypothetical protein